MNVVIDFFIGWRNKKIFIFSVFVSQAQTKLGKKAENFLYKQRPKVISFIRDSFFILVSLCFCHHSILFLTKSFRCWIFYRFDYQLSFEKCRTFFCLGVSEFWFDVRPILESKLQFQLESNQFSIFSSPMGLIMFEFIKLDGSYWYFGSFIRKRK